MHPLLVQKFVDSYIEMIDDSVDGQLIFTSHNSQLMRNQRFRQDEVWFVNNRNGSSTLEPLIEWNVRFDKRIEKAYLEGEFDGIPIFTDELEDDDEN